MTLNKIFAYPLLTVICTGHAFGADYGIQIQMLESEISKLTAEKREKYDDLDKCAAGVVGFKIAGVSLLGLTGVGVGVNIYQANKIGNLKSDIKDTQAKVTETNVAITDAKNKNAAAKPPVTNAQTGTGTAPQTLQQQTAPAMAPTQSQTGGDYAEWIAYDYSLDQTYNGVAVYKGSEDWLLKTNYPEDHPVQNLPDNLKIQGICAAETGTRGRVGGWTQSTKGVNCWCRGIIGSVMGKNVYIDKYESITTCSKRCVFQCASNVNSNQAGFQADFLSDILTD